MKNWRREAALKTMPLIAENRVRTPWREFWRRFRGQPVALLAGLFVLVLIVLAVIAPWIAPFDAENMSASEERVKMKCTNLQNNKLIELGVHGPDEQPNV